MNRCYFLLIAFLFGQFAFADGSLGGFEVTLTLVIIALVALVGVIIFTALRFTSKSSKVSVPMNVTCAIMGSCAFMSLLSLGSSIDSGFQITCYITMFISIVLIFLNYRVGISK